ncbi:Hypothetical predicted protein [Mytilus galloprovincialis]|uniref:Uncharacterized protein n=1 Tax=Mytilus galloprovincialis TaxID=29158 RepID=A0A8B6EZ43_MYTGA|nr:Hypothetical predicted protein [Mytilus galloprovincialis]
MKIVKTMKYIAFYILAILPILTYTFGASISFSHHSGISTSCTNGKCKTVSDRGHVSVDCKNGNCNKDYSSTQCKNGKCTHTGDTGPTKDIPEPKWDYMGGGFDSSDFGDMSGGYGFGGFRECYDGQIEDMYYESMFNRCYKTVCINGLWKDQSYRGRCHK